MWLLMLRYIWLAGVKLCLDCWSWVICGLLELSYVWLVEVDVFVVCWGWGMWACWRIYGLLMLRCMWFVKVEIYVAFWGWGICGLLGLSYMWLIGIKVSAVVGSENLWLLGAGNKWIGGMRTTCVSLALRHAAFLEIIASGFFGLTCGFLGLRTCGSLKH